MATTDTIPLDTSVSRRPAGAWRWVIAVLSLLCMIFVTNASRAQRDLAWNALAAALVLSAVWTVGLRVVRATPNVARGWRWWRLALGLPLAVAGTVFFARASNELYLNWAASFDRTWLTWMGCAVLIAVGLDVASGPWTRTSSRTLRRAAVYAAVLALLVAVAAAYRLGNIAEFPGEGTASQVEDLQTGQWGQWFQDGHGRVRWEYLSHAWLAGIGIWLGGPTMLAMRIPFATVSVLKTIPLFVWLQWAVGPVGAIVGTALFVVSAWDIVLSRIPNNQNALIVAIGFALLAGPVRRGRPSAYVCLGIFGGYLLHEYVAYRPAIFLMLVGAIWFSLRDRHAPWLARLGRPLVPIAIVVAMGIPLFMGRLGDGRVWDEYFNGWNRAKAQAPYYNTDDDWRASLDKRVARTFDALSLFYFSGDSHPARRVQQPLVDVVTGVLLIIGVGCALAHAFQSVLGLTLAGLIITITGTLILTGNFDIGRVGGAVPYVYACVGYAAASLDALARGRGRRVRIAVWIGLAAAVAWAAYLNTNALRRYYASPSVHRAYRHNLALLSGWLGQNARPDEQIVALAPGYHHVLLENDAAWLRGREMKGIAAWDLSSALQYWLDHPGKTLFVLFAGEGTKTAQAYMQTLLPGVAMHYEPDPLKREGDIAFAHVDSVPPHLAKSLAEARCRGARAEFNAIDRASGQTVHTEQVVVPFIDAAAIPGTLRNRVSDVQPTLARVSARYRGEITITTPGEYRFASQVYPGSGMLMIDGKTYGGGERTIKLAAGPHQVDLQVTFDPDPLTMVARLYWQGPDSGNQHEIVPFYRLTAADPSCVAAGTPPSAPVQP